MTTLYRVIARGQMGGSDEVLYCGTDRVEAYRIYEINRVKYEWTQPQARYQSYQEPLRIQRRRMAS